jgi:hypothetical protein
VPQFFGLRLDDDQWGQWDHVPGRVRDHLNDSRLGGDQELRPVAGLQPGTHDRIDHRHR